MIYDLILIIIIVLVFFYLLRRYGEDVFFALPGISFLMDMAMGYYHSSHIIVVINILIFYIFIIWFFYKRGILLRLNIFIYLFFIYTWVLIFFSSNIIRSIAMQLNIFASLLIFPIGYMILDDRIKIRRFINSFFIIILLFMANIVLANIIGTGYVYGGSMAFGAIRYSALYAPAFVILFVLLFIEDIKNRYLRIIMLVLIAFGFIIILLSMRRMAIFIVVGGYIIYFLFYKRFRNILKYGLLFLGLLILAFPLYYRPLMGQIEARQRIFSPDYSLSEEYRYQETIYIWGDILSFEEPIKVLFGQEIYNSRGHYAEGKLGERTIHADYNLIVHGAGIIGLILYLLIFAWIFINSFAMKGDREYYAVFMMVFILALIIGFIGRLNFVTYRMMIFALLGGIYRVFSSDLSIYARKK